MNLQKGEPCPVSVLQRWPESSPPGVCFPLGMCDRQNQPRSILHGHHRVPVIRSVLGHPASPSVSACSCFPAAQETGWWLRPALTDPSGGRPRLSLGSAWHSGLLRADWGLTSRSAGGRAGHPRASAPGAPVYMCFHSLSLQGSDLPSKRRPLLFSFVF